MDNNQGHQQNQPNQYVNQTNTYNQPQGQNPYMTKISKEKKPFYQRWWFILIAIIIVLAMMPTGYSLLAFLVSFICLFVFPVLMLISKKKRPDKATLYKKIFVNSIAVFFISVFVMSAKTPPSTVPTSVPATESSSQVSSETSSSEASISEVSSSEASSSEVSSSEASSSEISLSEISSSQVSSSSNDSSEEISSSSNDSSNKDLPINESASSMKNDKDDSKALSELNQVAGSYAHEASSKTSANSDPSSQAKSVPSDSQVATQSPPQVKNQQEVPTQAPATTGNGNENNFDTYSNTEPIPGVNYIGNSNTFKFHNSTCKEINKMNPENQVAISTREEAIANGYVSCGKCNP